MHPQLSLKACCFSLLSGQLHTISDSVEFVNSREKPLALYLFTNNEDLKNRVITETSAGALVVNDTVIHVSFEAIGYLADESLNDYLYGFLALIMCCLNSW